MFTSSIKMQYEITLLWNLYQLYKNKKDHEKNSWPESLHISE